LCCAGREKIETPLEVLYLDMGKFVDEKERERKKVFPSQSQKIVTN
jgi:hypothetical protein